MNKPYTAVWSYGSQIEAELGKQLLEQEGINSEIRYENLQGLGEAAADLKLVVGVGDAPRAREILNRNSEGAEARIAGGKHIPCPECGSGLTQVIWHPPKKYFAWLLQAITRDMTRAIFRCDSCGNEWDTRW